MRFFRSICSFFGLISFWIVILFFIPGVIYIIFRGTGIINIIEISITMGSSASLLSKIYESISSFNYFFWIQIIFLVILFCCYFIIKYYRYWLFNILSTIIVGFICVIIPLFRGHDELLSYVMKPHTENIDHLFVVPGYQKDLSQEKNAYYRQNKWLDTYSGTIKGMSGDIKKMKEDLREIINLPYSKTVYNDPALPPMSRNGEERTSYIWQHGDKEMQHLWYLFVRQRIESFGPLIEVLLSSIVQNKILLRREKELPLMSYQDKETLRKLLTPYDINTIYKNTLIKEYHLVKFYTVDEILRFMKQDNIRIPSCFYDPEHTKYVLGRYFNYAINDSTHQDMAASSLSKHYGKEYLGYNFVGRNLLDGMIPRIDFYNRLSKLENQRKILLEAM